jgi:hypothetical protein
MTHWNTAAASLAIGGLAVFLGIQQHAVTKLRGEADQLKQQLAALQSANHAWSNLVARTQRIQALRLPAPTVPVIAPLLQPAVDPSSSNVLDSFPELKNKAPHKLSATQVDAYLQKTGRNATGLLTAYHLTGDAAHLLEAMEKFPTHPQVALTAALRVGTAPAETRRWLEAFKQADPENALPDYLSALNHFQTGQPDQAVQALLAASSKPHFEDYLAACAQSNQEAYLAAGYPTGQAEAIGLIQQALIASGAEEEAEAFGPLPALDLLKKIKALGVTIRDLAKSYQQSGDQASGRATLQIAVELGRRYNNSAMDGLSQLVGTATELIALRGVAATGLNDSDGRAVHDRITQLNQQRSAIRRCYQDAVPLLGRMSEEHWQTFSECAREFGQPAAMQWALGKFGEP